MRKIFAKKAVLITTLLIGGLAVFSGCGSSETAEAASNGAEAGAAAVTGTIHVITREAGSGTRDAFVDITGIYESGVDRTWDEALVETGTGAVITAVAGNPLAIGYISLGAMRDDVRALPVNGVTPSVAAVQDGSYPLFRSFYMAIPTESNDLAQDFIEFILSTDGQAVVASQGFITPAGNLPEFGGGGFSGSLVIEGSTSVAPLMNVLAQAYKERFDGVTIDVHSTGSGAGIQAATEGRVDLGLSSRALRETELEAVGVATIAHDGIAVIVNPSNTLASISIEEIRDIFMGGLTRWESIE